MVKPKELARQKIDQTLEAAGWIIQDVKEGNIHAGKGVVVREYQTKPGHGFADYVLNIDGKAGDQRNPESASKTRTKSPVSNGTNAG